MHLIHVVNPASFCEQIRVQRSSHTSHLPCTSANRQAPPHQEAAVCTVDKTFHVSSPQIKKEHAAVSYFSYYLYFFKLYIFVLLQTTPFSWLRGTADKP